MIRHPRILAGPRIVAGTALSLLMASAPLGAYPLTGSTTAAPHGGLPLVKVQEDCPEGQECGPRQRQGRERQRQQEEGAAPERQERRQRQERQQEQQAEPGDNAPRPERPQRRQREEAQPEAQRPEPEAQRPEPQERPQRRQQRESAPEEAPRQQPAPRPEPEQAVPERPRREAPPEAAPREEAPRPERQRREEQRREAPAERQPDAQRPAEQPPAAETPTPEVRPEPEQRPAQRPDRNRGDTQAQPEGGSRPAERPRDRQPDQPPVPPAQEEPAAGQQGQAPEAPAEAPILDSQKAEPRPEGERPRRGDDRNRQQGERPDRAGGDRPSGDRPAGDRNAQRPPVDPGPPPVDDRAAQEAAQPREIRPATAEEGRRRDRRPDDDLRRRERPSGADIVRELGDRLILQLGGETIVESNERPRMTRGARDVYYEDLPQGRTREVILRDNGVRIVTIRNRYGDVVQRSRIDRDGREYVLSYVDERNYERVRDWRDPGDDLPPLRLTIPRDDYILESERARDPDDYYEFLEQPPVERVQRLYSVDEVKRSARVRDIARRVDLDTLTFEFGSASIPESEVRRLEGVATAMERLLDKNPAETFLIEGHTDAVGSDIANLALSDRRAEAVAQALTDVFGIPPENLSTQGYGERYLKVNTQAPERENRRVAIRRITPLVAPVASAK